MTTVALVEDHPHYRSMLSQIISEIPDHYIIGDYSSAEEAMNMPETGAPDLMVVDIELGKTSGVELLQSIRPKMTNTQFLMCTSHQDSDSVFKALEAGADGYIVKGCSAFEIAAAIAELKNGGAPMSPYIARKVLTKFRRESEPINQILSVREVEVLSLLSTGLLYKEISGRLNISTNTVKNHCKNIYKRMHVQNKVEAINKFRAQC